MKNLLGLISLLLALSTVDAREGRKSAKHVSGPRLHAVSAISNNGIASLGANNVVTDKSNKAVHDKSKKMKSQHAKKTHEKKSHEKGDHKEHGHKEHGHKDAHKQHEKRAKKDPKAKKVFENLESLHRQTSFDSLFESATKGQEKTGDAVVTPDAGVSMAYSYAFTYTGNNCLKPLGLSYKQNNVCHAVKANEGANTYYAQYTCNGLTITYAEYTASTCTGTPVTSNSYNVGTCTDMDGLGAVFACTSSLSYIPYVGQFVLQDIFEDYPCSGNPMASNGYSTQACINTTEPGDSYQTSARYGCNKDYEGPNVVIYDGGDCQEEWYHDYLYASCSYDSYYNNYDDFQTSVYETYSCYNSLGPIMYDDDSTNDDNIFDDWYYNWTDDDWYYNSTFDDWYYNYTFDDWYYNYTYDDDSTRVDGYMLVQMYEDKECTGTNTMIEGLALATCLVGYDVYGVAVNSVEYYCYSEANTVDVWTYENSTDCTGSATVTSINYVDECTNVNLGGYGSSMYISCSVGHEPPQFPNTVVQYGYEGTYESSCESAVTMFVAFSNDYCFGIAQNQSISYSCDPNTLHNAEVNVTFYEGAMGVCSQNFVQSVSLIPDNYCMPVYYNSPSMSSENQKPKQSKAKEVLSKEKKIEMKEKKAGLVTQQMRKKDKEINERITKATEKFYEAQRSVSFDKAFDKFAAQATKEVEAAEVTPDAGVYFPYSYAIEYTGSTCSPTSYLGISVRTNNMCLNYNNDTNAMSQMYTCSGTSITRTLYNGQGCNSKSVYEHVTYSVNGMCNDGMIFACAMSESTIPYTGQYVMNTLYNYTGCDNAPFGVEAYSVNACINTTEPDDYYKTSARYACNTYHDGPVIVIYEDDTCTDQWYLDYLYGSCDFNSYYGYGDDDYMTEVYQTSVCFNTLGPVVYDDDRSTDDNFFDDWYYNWTDDDWYYNNTFDDWYYNYTFDDWYFNYTYDDFSPSNDDDSNFFDYQKFVCVGSISTNSPVSRPTLMPITWPTFQPVNPPTMFPTSASAVVLAASQVINGCGYQQYVANMTSYNSVLMQTIVTSMGGLISYNEITYFYVYPPASSSASGRSLATTSGSTDTSLSVTYTLTSFSGSVSYNTLYDTLNTAVTTGVFNAYMNTYAAAAGATGLVGATSTSVEATNDSPSSGSSNNNGMSAGYIAMTVILVLFGCALIAGGGYYFWVKMAPGGSSAGAPAASPTPAAATGEKATVIQLSSVQSATPGEKPIDVENPMGNQFGAVRAAESTEPTL